MVFVQPPFWARAKYVAKPTANNNTSDETSLICCQILRHNGTGRAATNSFLPNLVSWVVTAVVVKPDSGVGLNGAFW